MHMAEVPQASTILPLPAGDLHGDEDTFEIVVSLRRFQAQETQVGDSLFGKELIEWWCLAKGRQEKSKLEITGAELLRS